MEPVCAPPPPEDEWAGCLAAARAGCPDALGQLLERFRPTLLVATVHVLAPDLRGKADEADLVQDALLEGQKDFHTFRGERPEELLAWLKQILSHNLANFRRHYLDVAGRNLRREVPFVSAGSDAVPGAHLASDSVCPDEKAARREEFARLNRAVDRLPDQVRVVVVWRSQDGLSFDEIGRRLDRTAEAARQIWWRAIHHLRSRLGASD